MNREFNLFSNGTKDIDCNASANLCSTRHETRARSWPTSRYEIHTIRQTKATHAMDGLRRSANVKTHVLKNMVFVKSINCVTYTWQIVENE